MKLPEGWKEVELGKIFDFQKKSKIKAGQGSKKGKYKFFTSSDKQTKFINEYNQDGEFLIFATGGHAGIHYCNEKFATSTDCFIVNVDDKVLIKYVYYYLFGRISLLEEGFKGAGLKHISKGYIQDIKLFYPEDKETQKAIVSILEKAEKSKEWRKKADDLTKEFLKSLHVEMFEKKNITEVKLSEVTDIIMGQSPPGDSYNEGNEGTPFFQGKSEFTEKYPLVKKWTTKPTKMAKPNSVLMSVRAPVGSVNLCNIDCCIGRGLASILPKDKITLEFLYSTLQAMEDKIANMGSGSTFKAITSSQLRNLKIPLPPISLQNKFASIVKEVEAMKEQQKHSKNHIDKLFNALMQKAFKGELKI